MALRSWLIVPADSEKKLGMAIATGTDAIVLDLGESVANEAKEVARVRARDWLVAHRQQVAAASRRIPRWVRINALDSRLWRDDLIEVMKGHPDGVILPRAGGPEAVRQLSAEIYEIEQRSQIQPNATKVVAVAGETAASALGIAEYADASLPRLAGLTWNDSGLAQAIGATRARNPDGGLSAASALVRSHALLAAHARGLAALECAHPDHHDTASIETAAANARADGFTGMFVNHPAQVPAINAAFTPTEDELAEARAIVAALEGEPGSALHPLDRRMIDEASARKARRLLGLEE
jgi:citrate lyase subunit beta/citryl-CoA lyase